MCLILQLASQAHNSGLHALLKSVSLIHFQVAFFLCFRMRLVKYLWNVKKKKDKKINKDLYEDEQYIGINFQCHKFCTSTCFYVQSIRHAMHAEGYNCEFFAHITCLQYGVKSQKVCGCCEIFKQLQDTVNNNCDSILFQLLFSRIKTRQVVWKIGTNGWISSHGWMASVCFLNAGVLWKCIVVISVSLYSFKEF